MNSDFLHTGCVPYTCRQYSSMTRAHFYTYFFLANIGKKTDTCNSLCSSRLSLSMPAYPLFLSQFTGQIAFSQRKLHDYHRHSRRHQSRTLRSFIITNNDKYDMLQNASTGCCFFFYFRPCKQPQAFFTSRVIRIASVITIA